MLPLIGGSSSREGLVEVCTDVGYIPVDLKTFTIREANVLCRQMELGSGEQHIVSHASTDGSSPCACSAGFPVSAAVDLEMDILEFVANAAIAVVACTGSEDSFTECSVTFRRNQPPAELAAVSCIGEQQQHGCSWFC